MSCQHAVMDHRNPRRQPQSTPPICGRRQFAEACDVTAGPHRRAGFSILDGPLGRCQVGKSFVHPQLRRSRAQCMHPLSVVVRPSWRDGSHSLKSRFAGILRLTGNKPDGKTGWLKLLKCVGIVIIRHRRTAVQAIVSSHR
jgi:hypothetical protein